MNGLRIVEGLRMVTFFKNMVNERKFAYAKEN